MESASLGTVDLHPAIPVTPSGEARTQLQASGRFLVVLASSRVLIVDPVSGDVRVPETK